MKVASAPFRGRTPGDSPLNEKTVKQLKKYARVTGKNPKEVKKWWTSLNSIERTRERRRILQELAKG